LEYNFFTFLTFSINTILASLAALTTFLPSIWGIQMFLKSLITISNG
jgi:hypothetical protein